MIDGQRRRGRFGSDTTITTEKWSLLFSPDPGESRLYHLATDSKQEKNVIDQQPDIAHDLHRMLIDFMKENDVEPEILEPRLELKI